MSEEEKGKRYSVSLPPDLVKVLEGIARRQHLAPSVVATLCLHDALRGEVPRWTRKKKGSR